MTDISPAVQWLESPQIIEHTRWYDELSRPYTWQLPMFWLKNDTSGATPMTVSTYAYEDSEWRPL
ncbi:hypothetical protein ACFWY5_37205 [Nonomuraea sp. NPDC059007]|uniref:hypothetical protein n=1 Tax=Nonomuraea sp. NPDC059007 TaxID=3346692 RepID=UPI0036819178